MHRSTVICSFHEVAKELKFQHQTPLCFRRYLSSISRQDSILHPALVVDLVHDKCVDATENLYNRHCAESLPETMPTTVSTIPASEEPKEKQMVVFFSTAKVNFCFLQVACVSNSEPTLSPDSVTDGDKSHSVSLFSGSVSGVSAEVLSFRRKLAREDFVTPRNPSVEFARDLLTTDKKQKTKTAVVQSPVDDATNLHAKKSRRHRNTMTTASASCAQIHFQLSQLCDKDDIEHCVATAIPEESSRCKFQVNNSSYVNFTESFETHHLDRGENVNLLMLECGLDNVRFKVGSECASGSEVLPKIRERRRASGFPGELGQSFTGQNKPESHVYTNPLFDKELSLQGVRSKTQGQDRRSHDSLSSASSLSSSHRSVSSSSANDSDKESDADDDVTKPLLRPADQQEKEKTPGAAKEEEVSSKDAELARRTDVTLNFTNIWFNLASPSSFKTIPANYHLYNSIVTTVVPFVTAWVPPVTQLRQIVTAMESNHGRFLNSVFGCLLAQALPEYGRIAKAVRFR